MKIDNNARTSPFTKRAGNSLYMILTDWLIALLPCLVFGVYRFGYAVLLSTFVAVGICAAAELVYCLIKKERYNYTVLIPPLVVSMCMDGQAPGYLPFLAGGIIAALYLIRRFISNTSVSRYLSFEPLLITLAAVSLFIYHTPSPIDSVLLGSKPQSITVAQLILGNHNGGFGSVSFFCIMFGYIYLWLRKRIRPLVPILFVAALILGICIFYQSTDYVTQLDYISYAVFDGRILFAAIFMLCLPGTVPRFKAGEYLVPLVCGAALSFVMVKYQSCDAVYLIMALSSLLSRPLVNLKLLLSGKNKLK